MPNLNKNNMHNAVIKRGVLSCFQIIKNFLLLKLSSKRKNDGIREKCIKIEKIPKKEEKYSFWFGQFFFQSVYKRNKDKARLLLNHSEKSHWNGRDLKTKKIVIVNNKKRYLSFCKTIEIMNKNDK